MTLAGCLAFLLDYLVTIASLTHKISQVIRRIIWHLAEVFAILKHLDIHSNVGSPLFLGVSGQDGAMDNQEDVRRGIPFSKDDLSRIVNADVCFIEEGVSLAIGKLVEPIELVKNLISRVEVLNFSWCNHLLVVEDDFDLAVEQPLFICFIITFVFSLTHHLEWVCYVFLIFIWFLLFLDNFKVILYIFLVGACISYHH